MKSVPLDCNRKPIRYIHVEQFTVPLLIFPGSLALRLRVEEHGWLHFLLISPCDFEPRCRKKLLPTRIREKTMKKLVILLMLATTFVAFSQQKIDFNHIPDMKLPIVMTDRYGYGTKVFQEPIDLSIYCSEKALKNLNNAKGCFITSVLFDGIGGGLIGVAVAKGEDGLAAGGAIFAAIGVVLGTISVVDFVSHFQWEYRRKQVDLYLTPTGATLKF